MDLSQDQLDEIVTVDIDPRVKAMDKTVVSTSSLREVSNLLAPVTSVDYRDSNDVSSIKDQGSCGSCWSFSTVGLYESWMMFKGEREFDFSEEYILECTTPYTFNVLGRSLRSSCGGGYVDFAGDLIRRNGLPNEVEFPYKGLNFGEGSGTPTTENICQATPTTIYAGSDDVT